MRYCIQAPTITYGYKCVGNTHIVTHWVLDTPALFAVFHLFQSHENPKENANSAMPLHSFKTIVDVIPEKSMQWDQKN